MSGCAARNHRHHRHQRPLRQGMYLCLGWSPRRTATTTTADHLDVEQIDIVRNRKRP